MGIVKILHVSLWDNGGAGNAAYRLHRSLLDLGISSSFLCLNKKKQDETVYLLDVKSNGELRVINNLGMSSLLPALRSAWDLYRKLPFSKVYEIYTDLSCVPGIHNLDLWKEADVVNLHWVAGMLDYKELGKYFVDKKIVWTLHDMNSFTGGCHYSGSCTRYQHACYDCPMLGYEKVDYARDIWNEKNKALKECKIHVVTPSKWLGQCAQKSSLLKKKVFHVIPYSLPVETIFKPHENPREIKKILGIESTELMLLFVSESVSNTRKGLAYLLPAVSMLPRSTSIKLVLVGKYDNQLYKNINIPIISVGTIAEVQTMAALYSAADAFVIPSLEDNLPNVVLESLACGTPVVGFNIGGIPDMVEHLKTGYLAKEKDVDDLAYGIVWTLDNSRSMENNCRMKAVSCYAPKVQANAYIELYQSLLCSSENSYDCSNNNVWQIQKNPVDTVVNSEKSDIPSELNSPIELMKKKQWFEAQNMLLSIVQNDSTRIDAFELLALCFWHQGVRLKAINLVQEAILQYPDRLSLRELLLRFKQK
jgi:glycosyltransferase involved in cell wall biosynthesis